MILSEAFYAAESAWKQSQDTPHDFLDSGADERARLHAEYLAAAFAWINEPSPLSQPAPITDIDPQPAPSRLSGVVSDWNRDKARGTISYDGGTVSFWTTGLTQAYTPGIGDQVTFRLGISTGYGEVSECAVGVTCTDMPAPVLSPSQVKARQEAQKTKDLRANLAARREERQAKREQSR